MGIEFSGGAADAPRWYPSRVQPDLAEPKARPPEQLGFLRPSAELDGRPERVVRPPAESLKPPEPTETTKPAAEIEAARQDHRIEAAHAERITKARGEKGFIDQVKDFANNVVTQVIERAAFVVANHIAPGIGGHIVNCLVEFKNAIDNIENLSRHGTIELQIPVVTGADGMFGLWVGPTISENEKGQTTFGVGAGPTAGIYEPLEVGEPDIEVAAPDDEASNKSASASPELKIAENREPTTTEVLLGKHDVITQYDESVTRHKDPTFSDLQSDYPQQKKPPGRPKRLFVPPKASLEWIESEEKRVGSRAVGSPEHGVDGNAYRAQSTEKRVSSISEIPRAAAEGHEALSPSASSPVFEVGNDTHAKGSFTNGSSGGSTAGSTGSSAGGAAFGARVSASKIIGVVVWGSATAIAAWANSPVLSAHVLLRYVKQRIFDDIYDGSAISVTRQRKAVRNLEMIIFVDTVTGVGLWVDMDLMTQDPAATLLMKIDPKNTLKPIRFFRYDP